MPATNPPTWAMNATPPPVCSVCAIDPTPLTNWMRIHSPSMTMAGTATIPPRDRTRTRLRGKRIMYPPSTPLIAPDAPTVGTPECEEKAMCARLVERHVLPLVEDGSVRVPVAATYPLDDVAAAYDRFEEGGKLGKIVLDVA